MGSYRLTPLAKADLIEIGQYSAESWGYEKAEVYLTLIDVAFQKIADDKSLDRSRDDLKPGLLMHKCQLHLIFFRRSKVKVEILRVLHEKRDHKRHL